MSIERVYTTAEAAEILRESVLTTMRKCRRGEIAATKTGRSWRITESALEAYIAPTNQPASEPAPEPEYVTASAKRRASRRPA